ncbi:MAG: hypothetical protein KDA78_18240, partial [Planctomycetaceae bacterium]|nr:hypothetical protein [Planctomycetaceae bacterium]
LETLRVDFDQDDRLLDHMLFAELDMVPDRVIQIGRYSYFNGLDFVFVLRKTLRRLAYHFQSGNWEEGRLYGNEYEFNRKELFTDDQLMEVFETGRNWTGLICAFSDAEKYHFPNRGGDLSAAGCLLRIEFARLIRYLRSIDHQLPAEFVFPAFGTLRNDEQIVWSKSIPKIILRKIFAEHGQREMPPTTFKNRCRQGKIILHPDDHMANSARVDVRCLPPGWEKHLKKSSQN